MSNLIVKTVSSDDGTLELGSNTSITQSLTANTITMGGTALSTVMGPYKNKIINGNFDIWQRGTSNTSSGYYTADRWFCVNTGSSKTASQQSFTLGQTDVPGEPKYWLRHVVTSSAGAGNLVYLEQKIESVRSLAGKTATLSFYAKADASKNIAVTFYQNFGTGGSPSSGVTINPNTIALTSSWQKITITVSIPSISGKTVGSTDDGYLSIVWWFDAGSNWNSDTNSLGQQSGTFDIAQVQLEEGPVATAFESRHIGQELALCQRYYEKTFSLSVAPADSVDADAAYTYPQACGPSAGSRGHSWRYAVLKRGTPTVTSYNPITTGSAARNVTQSQNYTVINTSTTTRCFSWDHSTGAGTLAGDKLVVHLTADAEL